MLHIHILCLGKLKESYWQASESEYLKRLKPYAKVSIQELPEEAFSSTSNRERTQEKEADKLLKALTDQPFTVLHERGQEFTSPEFAEFLEQNSSRGEKIIFVIGGPLGLHPTLLQKATKQISLSSLTFPHQMVRTILLEQVYRSITIQKNKPYHY